MLASPACGTVRISVCFFCVYSSKYLKKIKIQKTKSNSPSHPHFFSSRGDPAHIERFNLYDGFWGKVCVLGASISNPLLHSCLLSLSSSHMVLRLPKIKPFGGRGISHTSVSSLCNFWVFVLLWFFALGNVSSFS